MIKPIYFIVNVAALVVNSTEESFVMNLYYKLSIKITYNPEKENVQLTLLKITKQQPNIFT